MSTQNLNSFTSIESGHVCSMDVAVEVIRMRFQITKNQLATSSFVSKIQKARQCFLKDLTPLGKFFTNVLTI